MDIEKTLAMSIIEPVHAEWSAPIVFAPKKNVWLQFYIYFHKLNSVIIRNS